MSFDRALFLKEKYLGFCDQNNYITVTATEIYHYFDKTDDAESFAQWLTIQPILAETLTENPIETTITPLIGLYYYVTLSSEQFNLIMGDETAFSSLLPEIEIDEAHAFLKRHITHFHAWEVLLKKSAYQVELNQRRLLLKRDGLYQRKNIIVHAILANVTLNTFKKITELLYTQNIDKILGDEAMENWIDILFYTRGSKLSLYLILNVTDKFLSEFTLKNSISNYYLINEEIKNPNNEKAAIKIFNKLTTDAQEKIIFTKYGNQNLLHQLAHAMSAETLLELFQLLSTDTLSKAIQIFTVEDGSLLTLLAEYNKQEALLYLINHVSKEALSQAVALTKNTMNALVSLAYNQQEKAFSLLIDLLPANSLHLRAKETYFSSSVFSILLGRGQTNNAIKLLKHLNSSTFSFFTKADPYAMLNLLELAGDITLVKQLLENGELYFLLANFISQYCQRWLEGVATNKVSASVILKKMEEKPETFSNEIIMAYKKYLQNIDNEQPQFITLSNDKQINLTEVHKIEALEKIFQHGLKSYQDLHLINQYFHQKIRTSLKPGDPEAHLIYLLDTLDREESILCGAGITLKEFLDFPGVKEQLNSFIKIYNCIRKENGLIKIITQKSFPDFIKQLKDYAYRPKLRKFTLDSEKTATHKYVHTEDKIIPYVSHKQNKKSKNYEALKKQSFTLLSYELSTPVYSEIFPYQLLVAQLFDQALCLPAKGFFRYDIGTFTRGWVGTEELVYKYISMTKDYSLLKDMAELRNFVRENPKLMTELLARVTREACVATVIARDTPAAREEAIRRANLLRTEVNIEVPIIFYNNMTQTITLFTEISYLTYAKAKVKTLNLASTLNKNHNIPNQIKIQLNEIIRGNTENEKSNPGVWFNRQTEIDKLTASVDEVKQENISSHYRFRK